MNIYFFICMYISLSIYIYIKYIYIYMYKYIYICIYISIYLSLLVGVVARAYAGSRCSHSRSMFAFRKHVRILETGSHSGSTFALPALGFWRLRWSPGAHSRQSSKTYVYINEPKR